MKTDAEKEKQRAYNAAYYQANKAKAAARDAAYYLANRQQKLAYQASYYRSHRQEKMDYATKYAKANAKAVAAYQKSYAKANPAQVLARNQERRALRVKACPKWARNDPRVLALHSAAERLRQQGNDVHVDHVFPLKPRNQNDPQGLHVYANLRIVPRSTNQRKHNRQPTEQEIAEQRLLMMMS